MQTINADPYVNYYLRQAHGLNQHGSGSLSYYSGQRIQRGHGIGNIFSSIFRAIRSFFPAVVSTVKSALPTVAKTVGRHALQTAVNVGTDLLAGKTVEESAKQRASEGFKNAIEELKPTAVNSINSVVDGMRAAQTGSGRRRLRHYPKKPAKRLKRDIFG